MAAVVAFKTSKTGLQVSRCVVKCCASTALVLQQKAPHMDVTQSEFLKHDKNAMRSHSVNGINKSSFPREAGIEPIS